jgi:hypothetical protein
LYKNDDFLVVLAAGNLGYEGSWTIGNPATAKNALAVGAVQLRDVYDDSPLPSSNIGIQCYLNLNNISINLKFIF